MRLSADRCTHSWRFIGFPTAGLAAAALLVACGGGAERAGDVTKGPAPGEAVKVEAGDNFFKPETLKVKPGDNIAVEVRNTGERPHDWTADDLGISTGVISPGEVFHATFAVPENEVEYVCTLHAGMNGTIQVS